MRHDGMGRPRGSSGGGPRAWLERARSAADVARGAVSALQRIAGTPSSPRSRVTDPPGARPRPFGVNVAGYFASEKGVGEAVRSDVRSLVAAAVPHVVCDFADTCGSTNPIVVQAPPGSEVFAFNLVHVNADQTHVFVGGKSADWFEGRTNIGFWVWELEDFPSRWRSCFEYFDEIWTPSRFAQEAISRSSPVPVLRFPHSIDVDRGAVPKWRRADLGIPDGAFVFLFMFDYYSVFERKNPLGLVEAFRRAFPREAGVWLLIKTSHSEHDRANAGRLARAIRGANVRVIDEVLGSERTLGLYDLCDAYVSLHRSEGFGMTLAEAMSFGKPVIATEYGGNVDFQNQANTLTVPFELRPLEEDHGPYAKGSSWAHPILDRAAELMRFLVNNPASAAALGARARADVHRQLHPRTVGAAMALRLGLLAERRGGGR
ncbi:MAG: glycosyltransferase family 4 protein [Deltaproteobacteria bacterium]|nr:glycosyltransferase family 4 protein [Deltaproteobacteria bacterium]